MLNRSRLQVQIVLVGGLMVTGCSVDNNGLTIGEASRTDAAADGTSAGRGGVVGTGGVTVNGTGGATRDAGAGGIVGTGSGGGGSGGTGSGGNVAIGTGGSARGNTGGSTGSGGDSGSGGVLGSGGEPGTGGDVGSGGSVGSGGVGTGGRAATGGTGGRGTGGAVGTCNASNCSNGCCMGTMCVTNRTDQRCGTAGAACAPCTACSQCSNVGVCGLISDARWNVVCGSATIAPLKATGTVWDSMDMGTAALPDPFCRFTLDGTVRSNSITSTSTNTLTPMWNQTITSSSGGMNITHNVLVAQPGRWSVDVIDDDGSASSHDQICSVTPRLTADDFAAGIVKFVVAPNCPSLAIQLVCAEN